jgi:hypothetical protein
LGKFLSDSSADCAVEVVRSAGLFLARYRMNHGRNGRSGAASPKVLVEAQGAHHWQQRATKT